MIFKNIFHGYFVSGFNNITTLTTADSRGAEEPFSPKVKDSSGLKVPGTAGGKAPTDVSHPRHSLSDVLPY